MLVKLFDEIVGYNGNYRSQLFDNFIRCIISEKTLEYYVRQKARKFLSPIKEVDIANTIAALRAAVTCQTNSDVRSVRSIFYG